MERVAETPHCPLCALTPHLEMTGLWLTGSIKLSLPCPSALADLSDLVFFTLILTLITHSHSRQSLLPSEFKTRFSPELYDLLGPFLLQTMNNQ